MIVKCLNQYVQCTLQPETSCNVHHTSNCVIIHQPEGRAKALKIEIHSEQRWCSKTQKGRLHRWILWNHSAPMFTDLWSKFVIADVKSGQRQIQCRGKRCCPRDTVPLMVPSCCIQSGLSPLLAHNSLRPLAGVRIFKIASINMFSAARSWKPATSRITHLIDSSCTCLSTGAPQPKASAPTGAPSHWKAVVCIRRTGAARHVQCIATATVLHFYYDLPSTAFAT
jgi:hypothetical protein